MTVLTAEFTHFKLVIHLSKLQQPAILFFQLFCDVLPFRLSLEILGELHSLQREAVPNIQKPLILQQFHSDIWQHYMKLDQAGSCLSGVVFLLLMVFW